MEEPNRQVTITGTTYQVSQCQQLLMSIMESPPDRPNIRVSYVLFLGRYISTKRSYLLIPTSHFTYTPTLRTSPTARALRCRTSTWAA